MNIAIVTPAGIRSRYGNRNTATRWAALLRKSGHRVRVIETWDGKRADVMIALHARRSHDSIRRCAARHPDIPIVLALTGTDLYRDIHNDANAQLSMQLARRMVVLQERGLSELPPRLRAKTRVIYQSAPAVEPVPPLVSCFEVTVSGHLREEKDPFRTAAALAHLPAASRIRVTHLGGARTPQMADEARRWQARDSRYRWLGELPHKRALKLLSRSRLMVISSRMEGGANVVGEAIMLDVPVIASRIPGNIGMLGDDYAGYYPVGNERALARLLWRAESNPDFLERLRRQCRSRRRLLSAEREAKELEKLLAGLAPDGRGASVQRR
jgi:putative glycosyltransferase (TIGR04348 family)